MPNINKVVFGNQTLIDLSTTTLSSTDQLERGVTAYDRAGNVITGTSTGTGAGGITQDQDGYLVLDDDAPPGTPTLISKTITENGTYDAEDDNADGYSSITVNVPSGSSVGLEYETGTFSPNEDMDYTMVSFSKTHSSFPMFIQAQDVTGTYSDTQNSFQLMFVCFLGDSLYTSQNGLLYGRGQCLFRSTSATSFSSTTIGISYPSTNTGSSSGSYPRYWATESQMRVGYSSSYCYLRAGRTYKWIAIWAPTT